MADYNFPVVIGSDTVDAQSGVFSRITDAVTKGIPNAAFSGALSIYNTYLDYNGKEAVDTAETIHRYDSSLGDYYDDNKEAIDLAGFVGTSFIPGAIGIKALKLAQSGEALGAVGRALNIGASKKNEYLTTALKQLGREGGTITADIVAAKRAQLAWSVADNVITSAAAELAIAATMNDSPIFEGQDYKDFASNILFGAAFGGVVGGLLDAGAARGVLKSAQNKIELSRREFDTVSDVTKFGLKKADEVLLFTENILKLPDDAWSTNFTFKFDGKQRSIVLDTADEFRAVKNRTEKAAFDTLALKLNELAEGGETTGQAMFKFITDTVRKSRETGQGADDVIDIVRGYLQGVKRVIPITEEIAENVAPKQFFVNKAPTSMGDVFSEVRTPNMGKQAYYLKTDDPTKIKFGSVARLGYDDARDAFEDGYDAVFTRNGRVAINPKSQVISRTPDFALSNKYFLDLESGSITPNAPVIGADLMKRSTDFSHTPSAVRIGKREFKQADSATTVLDPKQSLQQTTRFMWAKGLEDTAFKNRTIHWTDFALLDRAKNLPGNYTNSDLVKIELADGRLIPLSDVTSVPEYINRLKLEFLQNALNGDKKLAVRVSDELSGKIQGYDVRYLNNTVNVTREWIEDAITSNFAASRQLLQEGRDLNHYFNPQTVQIEYDLKAAQLAPQGTDAVEGLGPNFKSTAMLGHQYNLKIRQVQQENAARSVLGEDYDRFPDASENLSRQVSERGAGAGTLTSSNADYGRQAELYVQDSGKQVALVSQKWRDETIGALNPYIAAIRDSKEASAELGIITTALRRDARKYYLVTEELESGVAGRLIDREAVKLYESGNADSLDDAVAAVQNNSPTNKVRGEYLIRDQKVVDFLQNSGKLNSDRVQKSTTLLNAAGIARELDSRVVYVPPVDTRRYPFFAFVIAKEKIGATTDVAMITAKDAAQLRNLAKSVGEDYEVVFKDDTKKFFKAKGQYDYSQQINESQVNSALQKQGILGDFFPETRGENVLEDYVRWHGNSSDNLVRQAVQVKSRQFFNDLQWLAKEFDAAGTSAVKGLSFLRREVQNPFADYAKTALNISKQSEYPLLESLNEFVDRIGTNLYVGLDKLWAEFRGSKGKDIVSLQQANKLMEDAGLGTPYTTMEQYLVANDKYPRNLIRDSFQKVNFWLATTTLRFDFVNPLINIISTPIMLGTELSSLKTLIGQDSELAGKFSLLQSVKVPGQDAVVPSTTKLIGNAINNYFGKDKLDLLKRYRDNGDIRDASFLYHEVLDALAYRPGRKVTEWNKKVDAAVEKGARITGNNFADELTRFISADVMRQLSDPLVEAGKLTLKEQNAYISSFVNRVQGNYISSQRPIVFQGTTGAAVGLFQTYAFNVLQQLFRHVENSDKRALLTFAGLQTLIYGMNGLPFFDAINQHLIGSASGNVNHKDAYSALPAANKEIGDWLLYGTASAFPLFGEKSPSLYSRGDINPRHISILPLNPLDVPAVSASIKLVSSVAGFGKQVAQGADLSSSMLQALEHQGWNRPLAGFAQVLAGQTTTGKGSLISAANDLETTSMLARIPQRLVDFGGIQRIMGARPMDEAVALNNLYRNKSYDAMDRARIEALGQVVKTKLYANQVPTEEELLEFMEKYQQSGGRIENFSSSMQRWMKDANASVVNQMAEKLGGSSSQKMQMLLGAEKLQDYRSLAESPEPTE